MKRFDASKGRGQQPEKKIQDAIERMLKLEGWYIMRTHGNMYQSGFPDIFACHSLYGTRWIEVKKPDMKGSKFTPAQEETFPHLVTNGAGVWILTAATESEYQKLFKKCNYWAYTGAMK